MSTFESLDAFILPFLDLKSLFFDTQPKLLGIETHLDPPRPTQTGTFYAFHFIQRHVRTYFVLTLGKVLLPSRSKSGYK